jgi:hypothetical protein
MEPLSFRVLEEALVKFAEQTKDTSPGMFERWTFALGAFFGGVGALVGILMGDLAGLRIMQASFGLELLFLAMSLISRFRREWMFLRRPHAWFSTELERDYGEYRQLIQRLLVYPSSDVKRRLRYIKDRKAGMSYRFGLLSGGAMERLGVLPLLAVLYLQFKDWEFGDWQALGKVHMVGGLLLWALLLAYATGWHLVRLKLRVDGYEAFLEEVVRTHEERKQG